MSDMPEVLYHYCSLETFFKIIDSKCIWLSDSFSTNDFLENRWLELMLAEIIKKDPGIKQNQSYQTLSDTFQANRAPSFITCFSRNGDLLSQWRAYADDGFGVSIGFNTKYFELENNIPSITCLNKNSITLAEVIYKTEDQLHILHELLKAALTSEVAALQTAICLRRLSYIFKNPAFREEEEWRIIHTPLIDQNNNSDQINTAISETKFRACRYDLIPYFIFPFEAKKSVTPLKKIFLGPKNKASIDKMEIFLSAKGLPNVEILFSKASYR